MANPLFENSPSVDPKEIEIFNKLSSYWWDENGSVRALHANSKLMVQVIQDYFVDSGLIPKELFDKPALLKDKLILDVGCGGGLLSEPLAKTGATVIGLDINLSLIDVAKGHAALDPSLTNLSYVLESVEEHSAKNPEKYDVVVASYVLEHVDDVEVFLSACAKCVKPGGSIFISCINKTTWGWLILIVFFEYISRSLPIGTHDWNKFVPPETTRDILEKHGCKSKSIHEAGRYIGTEALFSQEHQTRSYHPPLPLSNCPKPPDWIIGAANKKMIALITS